MRFDEIDSLEDPDWDEPTEKEEPDWDSIREARQVREWEKKDKDDTINEIFKEE